MLRKRFFAPPTAALLAIALGLGGAVVSTTAASAQQPDTICPSTEGWVKTDGVDSMSVTAVAPTGKLIAEVCYKASTQQERLSINPELASVLITSTLLNPGNQVANISHYSLRLVDAPAVGSTPQPKPAVSEVGFYIYKMLDPTKSPSWPNSGPQTFIKSKPGTEWFPLGTFPSDLPAAVCGPGWAVQQDKIAFNGVFAWPQTITYPTSALGGVLVAAKHEPLELYTTVPACSPPVTVQECVTAVWSMPAWIGERLPSFDPFQTLVASYPAECFTLNVPVPDICGTQYQVDNYVNDDVTTALLAGKKLFGPNKPQESFPSGHTGWNEPKAVWKLVKNADCALATAAVAVDPASCSSPATLAVGRFAVSSGVTWLVSPSEAEPRSYVVTFTAPAGSLFANGTSTLVVRGPLDAALGGEECVLPITDASIAVTAATCLVGESLDSEGFVFDATLAKLEGTPVVNGDGSFTVVFTAIGARTTFDQSEDVIMPGRTVSDDGKTLTFTGMLAAADKSRCALATAAVAVDPASCSSPAPLAEDRFAVSSDVTWSVMRSGVDFRSYVVTFTAPVGSLFANGTSTLVVRGLLDAALGGEDCDLPTQPLTDALLAFNPATCLVGQTLNSSGFVFDAELAQLAGTPVVNDDGSFTVVFTAIGARTTFDQSPDAVMEGRVVSDSGKTLTFTGMLASPSADECQLPSLANWPASAVATPQICTPSGPRSGAITVQLSTGPAGNENPVRYYLAFGTAEQRELTSASTAVPTGAYTVTAETSDSADSVNNAGNTATFSVVVGAPAGGTCNLPTLAFTGASELTGVAGLIALLLTLTGVAMLATQRRARV
jgi:hypothetical protein